MASASIFARARLTPLGKPGPRVASALALIVCMLGSPAVGSAQAQRTFGEWAAVCQADTAGYCSANTRVRAQDTAAAAQSYAFRLQVWRAQAGDPLEVTFMTAGRKPGEGQALEAQVDRGETLTFAPGAGYRSIRGGNAYALLEQTTLAELLSRMQRGKRLELRYVDAAGQPASAIFSLSGFKQALQLFHREPAPTQARPSKPEAGQRTESLSKPDNASRSEAMPKPEVATAPRRSEGERQRRPAVVTEMAPAQQPTPSAGPPSRKGRPSLRQFVCRGNEPSWTLLLDHERGTLTVLEAQPQVFTGKFGISGEGRTPIMAWKGSTGSPPRELTAVIVEQACRDSMSDSEGQTSFAFHTQVTLPDSRKVRGCCNVGLPAAPTATAPGALESARVADFATKSADDWARLLPELQPAIDSCLARTPGGAPYVTKAWPISKGVVGVRTRGGDGTWYECIASAGGAGVDRIEMLPRGDPPLAGENFTLFTPAGGAPRAGNCWQHERVLDGAGKLKGYVSYNTC